MGKKNICDVCGGDSIGVAASSLAASSNAYCATCLRKGWEPWEDIVGLAFCTSMRTVKAMVSHANVAFFGKTWYDVREEADKIMDQYIEDTKNIPIDDWEEMIVQCIDCGNTLTLCRCDDFE